MEEKIVGVEEGHTDGTQPEVSNEGDRPAEGGTPFQSSDRPVAEKEVPTGAQQTPPPGYENVIEELWPDADGNPPPMTRALMSKLRSKYFTIRHSTLQCGHKFDHVNEPANNCEYCWFWFFGSHMKLVEVADQFYRAHGKKPMVGMRGRKFVKYFEKFMATLYQEQMKRKAQDESNSQEPTPESGSDPGPANGDDGNGKVAAAGEVRTPGSN